MVQRRPARNATQTTKDFLQFLFLQNIYCSWHICFSYGFDLFTNMRKQSRPSKVYLFFTDSNFIHVSNGFRLFLTQADSFCEVNIQPTDLLHHEVIKVAHVHETTLCVMSGAFCFWNTFCVLTSLDLRSGNFRRQERHAYELS